MSKESDQFFFKLHRMSLVQPQRLDDFILYLKENLSQREKDVIAGVEKNIKSSLGGKSNWINLSYIRKPLEDSINEGDIYLSLVLILMKLPNSSSFIEALSGVPTSIANRLKSEAEKYFNDALPVAS